MRPLERADLFGGFIYKHFAEGNDENKTLKVIDTLGVKLYTSPHKTGPPPVPQILTNYFAIGEKTKMTIKGGEPTKKPKKKAAAKAGTKKAATKKAAKKK